MSALPITCLTSFSLSKSSDCFMVCQYSRYIDDLRNDNKNKLFHFTENHISLIQVENKIVISTYVMLSPCTNEETDTMLHVLHSVGEGFENNCVRTIDTDVLVLVVASVNEWEDLDKLDQLWLAFGIVVRGLNLPLNCSNRSTSTKFGPHVAKVIYFRFFAGARLGSRRGRHIGQIQDGRHS